ncbi:MAG: dihydrodipicolinate synthase family protein [Candidatus Acidiferrum sp.]
MDLRGIYPAVTTPFAPDGSVALEDLKHNIRRYNTTDLAGYVVMGSTGEAVMLTAVETDAVLATAKEAADPSKRLIAGTGAESTSETIRRTKRAAELGYHAALVKTPYYYKSAYKPEVYIAHYRNVADASPIPVMLYSVPQFTGVTLETPEILALADHPNIIGIKDSSGQVHRVVELGASVPREFQILTGSASVICTCLAAGARGAILALASALPEKCVAVYDLFRRECWEQAKELQWMLAKTSKAIVSECGIAGVKFVMDIRGYRGGLPRLPLQPLAEEQKKRLRELLLLLEPATARA